MLRWFCSGNLYWPRWPVHKFWYNQLYYILSNWFDRDKRALPLPKVRRAFLMLLLCYILICFLLTGSTTVKNHTKAKGELLKHCWKWYWVSPINKFYYYNYKAYSPSGSNFTAGWLAVRHKMGEFQKSIIIYRLHFLLFSTELQHYFACIKLLLGMYRGEKVRFHSFSHQFLPLSMQ